MKLEFRSDEKKFPQQEIKNSCFHILKFIVMKNIVFCLLILLTLFNSYILNSMSHQNHKKIEMLTKLSTSLNLYLYFKNAYICSGLLAVASSAASFTASA